MCLLFRSVYLAWSACVALLLIVLGTTLNGISVGHRFPQAASMIRTGICCAKGRDYPYDIIRDYYQVSHYRGYYVPGI